MTGWDRFAAAVADAADQLGPGRLTDLAHALDQAWPRSIIPAAVAVAGFADAARAVLAAQESDGVADAVAAAYLRGVAAGFAQRAAAVRVESVWSGPATHQVPVRATAQVLTDVVSEAVHELLLMTYSARPHAPLLNALARAVAREVAVTIVVETLQGAGGALAGAEPAAAFATVPGVQLWHWPVAKRAETGAKMHAKLAVADRRVMLVSSANMTQSGVNKNIEAGLLVRGGTAPLRAAEHIAELKATGVLAPLRSGSGKL